MSLARKVSAAVAVRAVVAIGVATGAAVAVGTAVDALHTSEREEAVAAALADPLVALDSDRLETTLEELYEDGVSVSDDGRALLGEADEAAVEAAVQRVGAAGVARVFVVVWAPGQELGAYENDVVDLLVDRLESLPDLDRGHLLVWQGPQSGYYEQLGSGYSSYARDFSGVSDFVGDPARTLPRVLDSLAEAEYYERDPSFGRTAPDDLDDVGGVVAGVLVGTLLGGALVLAGPGALAGVRRRVGRRVGRKPSGDWTRIKDEDE